MRLCAPGPAGQHRRRHCAGPPTPLRDPYTGYTFHYSLMVGVERGVSPAPPGVRLPAELVTLRVDTHGSPPLLVGNRKARSWGAGSGFVLYNYRRTLGTNH